MSPRALSCRKAGFDREWANITPGQTCSAANFRLRLPVKAGMSFLTRLLGKNDPPKQRIRVCVECGMPVAEHKDWCSIRRGELEMREAKGN